MNDKSTSCHIYITIKLFFKFIQGTINYTETGTLRLSFAMKQTITPGHLPATTLPDFPISFYYQALIATPNQYTCFDSSFHLVILAKPCCGPSCHGPKFAKAYQMRPITSPDRE